MINEWIGKEVDESSRGLIWGTFPVFAWRDLENPLKAIAKAISLGINIWTQGLLNMKQECYPFSRDAPCLYLFLIIITNEKAEYSVKQQPSCGVLQLQAEYYFIKNNYRLYHFLSGPHFYLSFINQLNKTISYNCISNLFNKIFTSLYMFRQNSAIFRVVQLSINAIKPITVAARSKE
jgi:hypothetical protein